jgi:hypothetical protein
VRPKETAAAPVPFDVISLDDDMLEVELAPVEATPEPQPTPSSPAPTGDPAPKPRRRAAVSTGLSLADMAKAESGPASAGSDAAAQPVPEDETILGRWPELVATTQNRPRLSNALSNARLSVEAADDGKVLVFTVTNEAQKKWIAENLLHKLEGTFQQMLGSGKVRLRVEAAEFVQEEKKYLPSEQAKDLMSKNEELKNLVIDLGLDV